MNGLVEIDIPCPYCGELFPSMVDTTQGTHATIEDCAVCCRPVQLQIACEAGEVIAVDSSRA
jgi:hypothetical protein